MWHQPPVFAGRLQVRSPRGLAKLAFVAIALDQCLPGKRDS